MSKQIVDLFWGYEKPERAEPVEVQGPLIPLEEVLELVQTQKVAGYAKPRCHETSRIVIL